MIPRVLQLVRAADLEGRPVLAGRPSRLWAIGLFLIAGCGVLRPADPIALGQPDLSRIERVEKALRSAEDARARQLVAEEALAALGATPLAGGAAPFDERRYRLGEGIGGFIPGRHPVLRTELVVVRADVEDAGLAVVVEAARVLVERTRTENVPGRSLLFVLAPDPVDTPLPWLWPASRVHARIELAGDDSGALRYRIAWADRDTSITPAGDLEPVQRAVHLIERLLSLASPADTLGSRARPVPTAR